MVTLTTGAVRNRYLRLSGLPPGPLTLVLPDDRVIDTELTARGMVRWRGWATCFARHRCAAGSTVTLHPDGARRYRVAFA